jgi:TRAP transporter TAXI family solute receptor
MKKEKTGMCLRISVLLALSTLIIFMARGECVGAEIYRMSTASMGGNLYRLSAAVSKVLNEDIKDAQFTVTTGSPKENVLLVENGRIPIGATSPEMFCQVHEDDLKGQKTRIRTLWLTFPGYYYTIVPEDSPWKSFDDLKGKKICAGIKTGEGGVYTKILQSIGWNEQDMKNFFYIGKTEGMDAYKDGTVDAWAGWSGVPSPIVMELATSKRGIKLIPFKDSEMKKIEAAFPFYSRIKIPANSHEKIKEDCLTFSTWYVYIVRDDFPEDMAYKIAKVLDTRREDIAEGFKPYRDTDAQKLPEFSFFKIHPGVAKYLKERGVLKSN